MHRRPLPTFKQAVLTLSVVSFAVRAGPVGFQGAKPGSHSGGKAHPYLSDFADRLGR